MEYKYILASDMDFTLLLPGEDVSRENAEAIKALQEHKVAFTIATGRSSFLVGKFAERLGIDVPLITGNGGALFDAGIRKDIFSADFPEPKLRKILARVLEDKVDAALYSTTGIYFAPCSSRRGFCEDYNKDVEPARKAPLFDIGEDYLKNSDIPAFNKFLLIDPPEDLARELKEDKELSIVSSGPSFYDVMTEGVSKGKALLELCDILGIPRENSFAIGDSENDLSMISMAGHGIAMGNSDPKVKESASYVTARCEEFGFAKAVYDYILPLIS
ncbi:MAG: Cof-type HAD-IIB family hydrolase [Saccharofermentans sp.]|nr:Cof-type HAD-IIB family hydrolase [Saccharofermentans sp.]